MNVATHSMTYHNLVNGYILISNPLMSLVEMSPNSKLLKKIGIEVMLKCLMNTPSGICVDTITWMDILMMEIPSTTLT